MQDRDTPNVSRRSFLRNVSFATVILLNGRIGRLSAATVSANQARVRTRFAIASDFHYGQPGTPYEEMTRTMISGINDFHAATRLDCCVLNGDLIHNEKHLLPLVKTEADKLAVPYYVTRGNHDMVSSQEWKTVWNAALNYDAVVNDDAFIFGDTSNEKGVYLSPDLAWMEERLEAHRKRSHVFVFLHIPQAKWTKNAIDTPAFLALLRRYPNVRAVFHGHEHDQDGVKMDGRLPFLFDSHAGGNWGTDYKGYRVVELMDDGSLVTYIMNPTARINQQTFAAVTA